jgi:hypothetical protein
LDEVVWYVISEKISPLIDLSKEATLIGEPNKLYGDHIRYLKLFEALERHATSYL